MGRITSALVLSLALLGSAQAADLLGDELSFARRYPTPDTPYPVWDPHTVSTVVTADASDTITWSLAGSPGVPYNVIDPGAHSIVWTLPRVTTYIGAGSFDGYVITGFTHDIVAAEVVSNSTGLDIEVTHSARELRLDWDGLVAGNGSFVLSVAVVPEPGAMALMLAGLLGIGAWGRRHRQH